MYSNKTIQGVTGINSTKNIINRTVDSKAKTIVLTTDNNYVITVPLAEWNNKGLQAVILK